MSGPESSWAMRYEKGWQARPSTENEGDVRPYQEPLARRAYGQRAPVLRLPYQSRVLSANLELLEFLSTEEADIAIAFRTLPAQQGPAWVAPRRLAQLHARHP